MSGALAAKRRTRLDRFLGTEPEEDHDRRYVLYLLVIAIAGWALASHDFNLIVVALPTIAKDLKMSQGLLGFLVYGAMLVLSLMVGYGMDRYGRKTMWQLALIGAAIFTGLTYFVQSFESIVLQANSDTASEASNQSPDAETQDAQAGDRDEQMTMIFRLFASD